MIALRCELAFECLADHLVHGGLALQVAVDEIRQERREVVRKANLFVPIGVHPPHDCVDIVVANESCLAHRGGVVATMGLQYAFDLLPSKFTVATHVQTLEQLCDLEVQGLSAHSRVEFGDLTLDFLHDLHFALEKFGQTADSVIA